MCAPLQGKLFTEDMYLRDLDFYMSALEATNTPHHRRNEWTQNEHPIQGGQYKQDGRGRGHGNECKSYVNNVDITELLHTIIFLRQLNLLCPSKHSGTQLDKPPNNKQLRHRGMLPP